MKTEKLSRIEIYQAISFIMKSDYGLYSINELSDKTGIRWETIKNAVQVLKEIEVIKIMNKKYKWNVCPLKFMDYKNDSIIYFKIKIKRKDNGSCYSEVTHNWNDPKAIDMGLFNLELDTIKNDIINNFVPDMEIEDNSEGS